MKISLIRFNDGLANGDLKGGGKDDSKLGPCLFFFSSYCIKA